MEYKESDIETVVLNRLEKDYKLSVHMLATLRSMLAAAYYRGGADAMKEWNNHGYTERSSDS